MGTAERKEREKEQRRLSIIEAAEKVFLSNGFDNTTMDEIADVAELSKGTLYLYFKSKEELFLEIVKKGSQILNSYFKKAVEKEKNGLDKVKAIGEAFIKFYNKHKEYHEAMMFDHSRLHNFESKDVKAKCVGKDSEGDTIFVDVINEGIADGSIRKDIDPVKTSLLLWGQTMGVLQLIQMRGKSLEVECKTKPEDLMSYFFEYTGHALKA